MSETNDEVENTIDPYFYILIDCPSCDEEFHHGLIASFHEHNGRLAIPVDLMEQIEVRCPHCGTTVYYGELDYDTEAA
jgi:uncharacterized Zn finger protein